MALAFNNKPITTIKARVTGTTENVAFAGCTADNTLTPTDAATQINKVLAIRRYQYDSYSSPGGG